MRKILLMTVCALWAAHGVGFADEAKATKEQQLESIKKLRSELINKMPSMNDLFDNEHNGAGAAWNSVYKQYVDSIAALNKKIEVESAKTGDAKDQATLDQATAKVARFGALWLDLTQKFNAPLSQKWAVLNGVRMNLANLVADLANQDQVWLRAECDRGLLVAVFTELNKRADEVKAQASEMVADYIKRYGDDERTFKE